MKTTAAAATLAVLTIAYAQLQSQQPQQPQPQPQQPQTQATHRDAAVCVDGAELAGIVRDTTGATVAGASITLDAEPFPGNATGPDGRFRLRCVGSGGHTLHITAESFAATDFAVSTLARARGDIAITLRPQAVEQTVDVESAGPVRGVDNTENGASRTIQGDDLKALADDPDDLLRQLQQLTAGSGGNPDSALITVDGFQSPTNLPPKSSIAYIRINPDPFAAEYQEPPYMGGRVEIYTRPGQPRVHGALYMAYGGSALNARDPFSTDKGKLGKQRYGFDLSGPVRGQSDFAMSLEHRLIDNVAVVNAVQLDAAGNVVPINATVPAQQSRWEASARLGWQLGPKNTFIANYTTMHNDVQNVGVGGSVLQEGGYDRSYYEHVARFTDITTVSARIMHEARFSMRWGGDFYYPHSTAPQVQVAGGFTAGGNTFGQRQDREFLVEVLDDAIVTTKNHTLKFGTQIRIARERLAYPNNTNGAYIFGGGSAPALDSSGNPLTGTSAYITGLEQYRRAQRGIAGGTPTAYTVVTGSPEIDFTQTRVAFFIQDDWKLRPNLKVSTGLRYSLQNDPSEYAAILPRAGIAWSPDTKQTWTLRAHAGLFASRYSTEDATEFQRLAPGSPRDSLTIYNPVYGNPLSNAVPIRTIRTMAPRLGNALFAEEALGVEHSAKSWSAGGDYYFLRLWNEPLTRNINTPLDGNPYGVRPAAANLNILQTQNAAAGTGYAVFAHVEQHARRLNLFVGYVYAKIYDLANNQTFDQPQSAYSNAGEYVLRGNQNVQTIIVNGTVHLPGKVDLSTETDVRDGRRYNVTTGSDNNGDGTFNDRPQYAQPGNPNALATKFGALVATGGTGVFPRNAGVMPWVSHVDMNVTRQWILTPHAAKDRAQTLQVNARAANVLNNTNIVQVGSILGSPQLSIPYAADSGRRIEFGARYSF